MRWRSALILGTTLLLASCTPKTPAAFRHFEGPTLAASAEAGDLVATWDELIASSVDLPPVGDNGVTIPGFEPFNDPRILLPDGRFIVRGRNGDDPPISGWYQRNPASVPEGEDNPVTETATPPVRLFVYDPDSGGLTAISQVPDVHPFSTATSIGESPDIVLDVVVLTGAQVVAYTLGFNGAGYDIPRDLYVAPIPPH